MPRVGRRQGWISTIEAIHAPISDAAAWMQNVSHQLPRALDISPDQNGYIELAHSAECTSSRRELVAKP